MAWRFLNIGKANAEIERLALEVSTVTKERDDLKAAMEANASEAVKAAEDLQTQVTAQAATIATLIAERDAARVDLEAAKKDAASQEVKIQTAASHKAAEITASQGQPPLATTPAGTPDGTPVGGDALVAQFQAIKDPSARTAFYRKHEAAIKAASRAERSQKTS